MPEAFDRPLDDEQPEPEAVRPCPTEPKKWLEYSRQLVRWDSFAVVPDLNAKCRSAPAAADEDTPTGQRMIERVAHQIAQDTVEQRRMARHRGASRQETETHAFPPRRSVELLREAPQNGLKGNRLGSDSAGALVKM
jgi:hypothetical protein